MPPCVRGRPLVVSAKLGGFLVVWKRLTILDKGKGAKYKLICSNYATKEMLFSAMNQEMQIVL